MSRALRAACAAILLRGAPLPAQGLAAPLPSSPAPTLLRRTDPRPLHPSTADSNADAVRLVMGGLGLGIVGVVLGGYAGAKIEERGGCSGEDFCGLGGAFVGATVGETLLLPAGVHLANNARGSYPVAVGAASVAAALAWALTVGTQNGLFLLAIPAGQMVAAVLVELRTGAPPPAP